MKKFDKYTFLKSFESLVRKRCLSACEDYGLNPQETTIPDIGRWEEPNQWTSKVSIFLAPVAVRSLDLAVLAAGGEVEILSQEQYKQMAKENVPDYDRGYNGLQFEIKTSQSANGSFSGATNSKGRGKVDNYVFFSYRVDESTPLQELVNGGKPFVKEVALCFAKGVQVEWLGEASNQSSRTVSRIHPSSGKSIKKGMVFGDCKINDKTVTLKRVSVESI